MLDISHRALNPEEMALLVADIEKVEKKKRFHFRFTAASIVFLLLALILLLIFFWGKESIGLLLIAFVLIVIYGFSVVWGYKQNSKMFNSSINEIRETIQFNHVEVYKCFAEACTSFQNKSLDEPAHFLQVEESKILFLSGFDFYSTENFPNTDFEVVVIKANNEKDLQYELLCKGIYLKPSAILSDVLKKKLRDEKKYPNNLSIISGKLTSLESILLN